MTKRDQDSSRSSGSGVIPQRRIPADSTAAQGGEAATKANTPLPDTVGEGASVEIRRLTVRAGGRTLLRDATAHFPRGKITLLVGASGAGKTLLLRTLAGLPFDDQGDVAIEGEVLFDGRPAQASRRSVGVVFQHFALLDELSPLANVQLAEAHRPRRVAPRGDVASTAALLQELGVPTNVRTSNLSGGQRQRLAIARVLAYDPDVVLYDEPTSGLDSETGRQVAALLRSTHDAHQRTSLIVTHDYHALAAIADAVFLFDRSSQTLREIPREDWPKLPAILAEEAAAVAASSEKSAASAGAGSSAAEARSIGQRLLERGSEILVGTSRTAESLLMIPLRLPPAWTNISWGLKFLLHYLRLVAGPSAWLYVAMAGGIVGFVSTYFTFRYLPYRSYTEALFREELLAATGFALFRILIPLLVMILVAARCGAAVASDVGGKSYGRQLDALRTLRVSPGIYLSTGILYAFLLGGPLLVAIGFGAARLASLVVFCGTHPELGPQFWRSHFLQELALPNHWWYAGTGWMLLKTLLCSAGISAIAYERGARPKHSTNDVSRGITATILWSTLFVLVVHFAFAFFEFE